MGKIKVAVTYENGLIFQHFGHTEYFQLFTIENSQIVDEQIVPTQGFGHGALAGFLAGKEVQVLICGGIGPGAMHMLEECGIQVYAGAAGKCESAVEAFLSGKLTNAGITCHHHDGEHTCHSGEPACHGSCHNKDV